ncbi:MAG TPA: FecR domain-containing protein [Pedobacter sp.]|jgi:hypothetical protein
MEEKALQDILEKYAYDKPLSPDETQVLLRYLSENREQPALKEFIDKAITEELFDDLGDKTVGDRIYQNVLDKANLIESTSNTQPAAYSFWRVAASVIFILGISWGGYKYYQAGQSLGETTTKSTPVKNLADDALPGTDRAYLKLDNGESILLTPSGTQTLALQGGTRVLKQSGQLSYNVSTSAKSKQATFNTLTIPRGGKFQLILPDGSKVWMNSASSLRFPTAFNGRDRRVVLSGEAYFEVAKSKTLPFIVETNGMEVKVLGTHFNVAAYHDDEIIKTTLLEGSVQVGKNSQKVLLSPGKESTLIKASGTMKVADANLAEALAWKNELFVFKNADIKLVMRQLSRWYDMDVVFKDDVNTQLNGMISRNTNLSGVIKILQLSGGAHFKINGNLITVSESAPEK